MPDGPRPASHPRASGWAVASGRARCAALPLRCPLDHGPRPTSRDVSRSAEETTRDSRLSKGIMPTGRGEARAIPRRDVLQGALTAGLGGGTLPLAGAAMPSRTAATAPG